jgi:hypothetical protein
MSFQPFLRSRRDKGTFSSLGVDAESAELFNLVEAS